MDSKLPQNIEIVLKCTCGITHAVPFYMHKKECPFYYTVVGTLTGTVEQMKKSSDIYWGASYG